MLHLLEKEAREITITEFEHERAGKAEMLYENHLYEKSRIEKDWQVAISQGKQKTKEQEVLVITGSLHFLSLVRDFVYKA